MLRTAGLVVLLLMLPSCIAAIGNKATGWSELPTSALPIVREKVDALRRIVALRQQQFEEARARHGAGQASSTEVAAAEIELSEANIRLLDARVELQALEARARD